MPYIKQEDRRRIYEDYEQGSRFINTDQITTAGELQYAMAVMFKSFMERKGLNYQNCNDVIGALAGAQMEFYRKVVSKYEQEKESENGSV